ncbi:MAG: hypothetical protein MI975_00785 [Cytophagales bacterium]|nr:hypothetical protein [Cytophagales bacterium]
MNIFRQPHLCVFTALLCAVCFMFFTACENSADEDSHQEEQISLLTEHPWQLEKVYTDGEEVGLAIPDIPFIAVFNDDEVMKAANFSNAWEEEWTFGNNLFLIDNEPMDIKELDDSRLVLSYSENDKVAELHFKAATHPVAFPADAVLGNTYYVSDAVYSDQNTTKAFSMRTRVLIEAFVMTFTDEELWVSEWEAISGAFIFIHTDKTEGSGLGFKVVLNEDGSLAVTRIGEAAEIDYTLSPCLPVNYLCGPEWVLDKMKKNGVDASGFPLPKGTKWYFNLESGQVEEQSPGEHDKELFPWEIVSNTVEDGLKISIEPEGAGSGQEFVMLKGTINELELQTGFEGDTWLLEFRVENE